MHNRRQAETTNMIIAAVLSMLVLLYWDYFIEAPRRKAELLSARSKAHMEEQAKHQEQKEGALVFKPRAELLQESSRVNIASSSLHGSIALKGLRFDDLTLARYRETQEPGSPEVTLFSPPDDREGYFAEFGWTAPDKTTKVPGPDTLWSADSAQLTPGHPVTFHWKNADGVTFSARIALDDKYLFTITQSAVDSNGKPFSLQTYAYVNRVWDTKHHQALGILHEGPLGAFDGTLKEVPYKTLSEEKDQAFEAAEGWLGISDKYWLAAILPPKESFTAHFSYYKSRGRDHYQADYLSPPASATTLRFFAGAKELAALDSYAKQYHIQLFDRAVDFGMFYFLTKPIFLLLAWLHTLVGNFGIAILILTVLVKLLMYPLASKSFASMHQMKELQPRMQEIRERYKDKVQMNQAIMELYKREKVNPASGCLPIFIQIPVFFSLYKVLYVSLEMRHAPFFGWIHDLSAPDPTNLFTLFGLLQWNPPLFLHLGIWPILMCATMIIQQQQSPPPPDPTQAKMMKMLPFFFLFLFSNVAAGLVIYWTWSNILTILQQWQIKRQHGGAKKKA